MAASLLPELWPLHKLAKELGKATHVLVSASRAGTFPPVVRVGAVWFVKADLVRAWFDGQHAAVSVTPAQQDRIRQAGQAEAGALPSRRPRQLRGRSAASS